MKKDIIRLWKKLNLLKIKKRFKHLIKLKY